MPATRLPTTPRRSWLDVGVGLAIVLADLSGAAWAWVAVHLQLFGASPSQEDYQDAARVLVATAAVVPAVTLAIVVALRRSGWLLAVAVVASAALLDAAWSLRSPTGFSTADLLPRTWDTALVPLLVPAGWPLLALTVTALVHQLAHLATRPGGGR